MTKNWDKTTIWLSSAENATSALNSCSMSLRPHWHWFTSFLGMYGLYGFLIINSILLDSGRGVTTGHARDGLGGLIGLVSHITKAIGMFHSLSWLTVIVMFGFIGWLQSRFIRRGFNFWALATINSSKRLTSSVKVTVSGLWPVHLMARWKQVAKSIDTLAG